MAGFLGSEASFLSDLLLISLLILGPAFTVGFLLARSHRGADHRLVMLGTYSIVVIFVSIYIFHNIVDGFPPLIGDRWSTFNVIYLGVGSLHSILASAALIMGARQLRTGHKFSGRSRRWTMGVRDRAIHSRTGKKTLVVFGLTAITGIVLYAWVFASGA